MSLKADLGIQVLVSLGSCCTHRSQDVCKQDAVHVCNYVHMSAATLADY